MKHTDRARTHCTSAFRRKVCIQHCVKKLLRVARPFIALLRGRHHALPASAERAPAV